MTLLTLLLAVIYFSQRSEAGPELTQDACSPLFYPEGCATDRFVLERHSFVDNLRKEVSCYARGHSSESIIIHILLLFGDPVHHFHNALLINPASVEKYRKVTRDSEFAFNNELMLLSKGREMVVQYDVAQEDWQMRYFDGSPVPYVPPYDAILSLDYYASLWSEYNSIVLERSRLSLRMLEPPFDQDRVQDNEDYDGFYKLWCNQSISVKRCHVVLPPAYAEAATAGRMAINGAYYGVTGLIIDPSRADNLLPYDLFVRWRFHDERNIRIGQWPRDHVTTKAASPLLLHLNEQFQYDVNRESGDIILGLDFLLFFQKAEYCMEGGYYKVWYYNHLYSWHEQHVANVFIISLFVSTLLSIFFYWVVSVNYNVQWDILDSKRFIEFPHAMVLNELVTYGIGLVVCILALVFVDDVGAVAVDATGHKQRAILFATVLLVHLVVGLFYLAWLRRAQTRDMFLYYRGYYRNKVTGEHSALPQNHSLTVTPGREAKVSDVLVRNTTINTVLAMALLLIFNYIVEDRPVFLGVCVVISAVATYYWLKMLLVSVQYLASAPVQWRHERRFLAYTTLSFLLFLAYALLAFPLVLLACFREFNTMYSDIILWIFGIHLYSMIVTLVVGVVFIITVKHFIKRHDVQEGEKKVKTE